MKQILGMLLTLTLASSLWAKSPESTVVLNPKLVLLKLVALHTNEKGGDELYFDMSVAKTNEATRFLRLPEAPMHWPSRLVEQIKDVTLWTAPIAQNEQATILLSLNEEDSAPVDLDDFIGSLQVTVKNEKGVLKVEWQVPNNAEKLEQTTQKDKNNKVMKFIFSGSGTRYEAYFSVL